MNAKRAHTDDDKQAWESFLSGDDMSYAYFYKKYITTLFSYGLHFTSDRELVKDCIQDVFVKVFCNRSKFSKTDNIKLYLFIALKNTLFNVFHKDKPYYTVDPIEPVFAVEFSVEEEFIREELREEQKNKINLLLESLTPRQKEVIYYRYIEELSIEDICLLMGMNYQSVQNLVQRALKKVRAAFPSEASSPLNIKNISRCS